MMGRGKKKSQYEKSSIFDISFTHKEEDVWPDGTHPMLFAESSCVVYLSFRLVALLFSGKRGVAI